mmetsp:Transcript_16956/g.39589  ORF Transcript_16956/g.39589 Transcript_16956/m.39589 type:complete len:342 (-) Transcript_16956:172-1197(-)
MRTIQCLWLPVLLWHDLAPVLAVRPQLDVSQGKSLDLDRIAENDELLLLDMENLSSEEMAFHTEVGRLHEILDIMGDIDPDILEDDVKNFIEAKGDVTAMTGTGQHTYEALKSLQQLYGALSPEEANSLAGLIVQAHHKKPEWMTKIGNKFKRKKKGNETDVAGNATETSESSNETSVADNATDEKRRPSTGNETVASKQKQKQQQPQPGAAAVADDEDDGPVSGQPQEFDKDPGMGSKVFKIYEAMMRTFKKFAGTRRQINALASFVAMIAPDKVKGNCILKLIFILYLDPDEDDYPYLPRKCGIDSYLDTMAYGGSFRSGVSCLLWLIVLPIALIWPQL